MPETQPESVPLDSPSSAGALDFSRYEAALKLCNPVKLYGKVIQVIGLVIESQGPAANVGEICHIHSKERREPILAEVVGFRNNRVLLMPIGENRGIGPGCEVRATGHSFKIKAGKALLGRVVDGLGEPIDGKGPILAEEEYSIYAEPPNPVTKPRITKPLYTGVRVLDAMLTLGRGQRIGVFSGSGVGKSTVLGMIARNSDADVNVIALVGERGRELRDFLERDLGEEGIKRSVVVCATSDKTALIRLKGAYVGTAIAEYFRDQGKSVLFVMDSVTRFAMAQREVGLAIGEPPATRGYTPSVFAILPKLLERSGTSDKGTITGIYSVLVEGDDMNEPVTDTTRSILDGHIVLSRAIAEQGRYPAVDVLQSISRLFPEVTTREHQDAAAKIRELMAVYQKNEDLINIGAYQDGSDPKVDHAKRMISPIHDFFKQRGDDPPARFEDTYAGFMKLASQ